VSSNPDTLEYLPEEDRKYISGSQISDRFTYIPQPMVLEIPWFSSRLVLSGIPTRDLAMIGRGLGSAWNWLKASGGGDGEVGARIASYAVPELAKPPRVEPSYESVVVQNLAREVSEQVVTAERVYRATLATGHDGQQALAAAYITTLLQGATPERAQTVAMNIQRRPFTDDEIMSSLPSEAEERVINFTVWQTDPSLGEVLGESVTAAQEMLGMPLELAFKGIGEAVGRTSQGIGYGGGAILGTVGLQGQAEAFRKAGQEAYEFTTEKAAPAVMGAVSEVFGRLTDVAVAGAAQGVGLPQIIGKRSVTDYLWPDHAGQGAGLLVADSLGLRPGDDWYTAVSEGTNLAANLVVGAKLMKAVRGFREGGRGPVPAELTPEVLTALKKRFGYAGRLLYELRGKTPEQWMQGRMGERFGNRVMEARAAAQADVSAAKIQAPDTAARLVRDFGMDPDLARTVSQATSATEAAQAYARHWRHLPDPFRIEKDMTRATEIRSQLDENVLAREQALSETEMGALLSTGTQLASELRRIQTRVSSFGPEIADLPAQIEAAAKLVELPGQSSLFAGELGKLPVEIGGGGVWQARVRARVDTLSKRLDRAVSRLDELGPKGESLSKELSVVRAQIERMKPPSLLSRSDTMGLKAELRSIEDRLARPDPITRTFATEWPRFSLMRRLRAGAGETPLGRTIAWLYNPTAAVKGWGALPVPHIARAFDGLYRNNLRAWLGAHADPGALRYNAELVITQGRRAGIPEPRIRAVIQEMIDVTNHGQLRNWVKSYSSMFEDSPLIASDMKLAMRQMYANASPAQSARLMRSYQLPDGTWVSRPTLATPEGWPLPGMSSQFTRNLPTMNMELVIEGTSFTRHIARNLRRLRKGIAPLQPEELAAEVQRLRTERQSVAASGITTESVTSRLADLDLEIADLEQTMARAGRSRAEAALIRGVQKVGATTISAPYEAWRVTTDASTSILKPGMLYLRVPAMVMRATSEDLLRATHSGYPIFKRKVYKAGEKLDTTIFDMPTDPRAVGSLLGGLSREGSTMTKYVVERWIGPTPPSPQYLKNMAHQVQMLQASPEMGRLIRMGPEKWADWMQKEGDSYLRQLQPELDAAGTTVEVFAREQYAAIQELTQGIPGLRAGIQTGRWGSKLPENAIGEHPRVELTRLEAERSLLTDRISEAVNANDTVLSNALVADRRLMIRRIQELKRTVRKDRGGVDLADTDAVAERLRQAYADGEWTPTYEVWGPTEVPDLSRAAGARTAREFLSERIYGSKWFQKSGVIDYRFSRERVFRYEARYQYDHLKNFGWPDGEAKAFAEMQAARSVSDLYYNLTLRASSDKFLRNVFWFGPLARSAARQWLIEIPSKYYWPVGAAWLYERAHVTTQFFKDVGLMKEEEMPDGTKRLYAEIPGLGRLLSKWTGVPVEDMVTMNPASLSLITGATKYPFLPGLDPVHGWVLGKAGKGYGGVFKALSDTFQPFGPEVSFFPAPIGFAYEAMSGKPFPGELLKEDYQQHLYDLGFDDALRQAYAKFESEGRKPPLISDFKTEAEFDEAQNDYINDLMGEAQGISKVFSAVRLIGSTIAPVGLKVDDRYEKDWNKLMNDLYGLNSGVKYEKGTPEYDAWIAKFDTGVEEFLDSHPFGFAYTVAKTIKGEAYTKFPLQDQETMSFQELLMNNVRDTLSPEDYATLLAGSQSRTFYQGRLQAEIDALGDTAPKVLLHGFERANALTEYRYDWRRHLAAMQNSGHDFEELWTRIRKNAGQLPKSFDAEAVGEAMDVIRHFQGQIESNGAEFGDIRSIQRALRQIWAEESEFGEPIGEVAQGIRWYSDNVLDEYFESTADLWDEVHRLQKNGLDAGPVFNQIREVNNKWSRKKLTGPEGLKYPSPEEVLYGVLPPDEQDSHVLHWITEPTHWLTSFQRSKSGFGGGKEVDDYYSWLAGFEQHVDELRVKRDISYSSNAWEDLKIWRENTIKSEAKKRGLSRYADYALGLPFERIEALGKGRGANWTATVDAARQVIATAKRLDVSPNGYSEAIAPYKDWFFAGIESIRATDPAFRDFLEELGLAMGDRDGKILFDALYFGNFSRYAPEE
jgi:hypothetical protein